MPKRAPIVEDGDRRYSIIFNPASKNLANVPGFDYDQLVRELPDFIRHLMSRPIDEHKANTPLDNRQKEIMMDMTEDDRVAVIKDWITQHKGEGEITQSEICRQVDASPLLKRPISPRKLRPIMERLGHLAYEKNGQLWYRGFVAVAPTSWCDTAGEPSEAETEATRTSNMPTKPVTDITPGGEPPDPQAGMTETTSSTPTTSVPGATPPGEAGTAGPQQPDELDGTGLF